MDIVLETLFHEESEDSSNEVMWFQVHVSVFDFWKSVCSASCSNS